MRLYYIAINVASVFSEKAQLWLDGHEKLHYKFYKYIESAHGKKIWFHCASLGEFEQARPLLEKIKLLHPKHKIILTFFSPSGFQIRYKYDMADYVCYLPMDTAHDARKFIRLMNPSLVIWVKNEFWFHHLRELRKHDIPVVMISATFRPGQIFFKWYGVLHRRMLRYFSKIYVQNQESKDLLQTLGVDSEVCADTRFDRVFDVLSQGKSFENAISFKADKKILIAGSTWPKDEDLICELINSDPFEGRFKYIIAPHDVSKENVSELIAKITKRKTMFARLTTSNSDEFDVAIVDSVGQLSLIYTHADIAYIGGGFGAGIHNILEPAVFGMPVIFGPKYQKSTEAKDMLAHPEWNAAFTIRTYDELIATIRKLIANNDELLNVGRVKSKEYVLSHTGGTDQIYSYLMEKGLLSDKIITAPRPSSKANTVDSPPGI